MAQALEGIISPHEEIHLEAAELIELSHTNRDAAYARYASDFKPKVDAIGEGLSVIGARYQEQANEITASTQRTSLFSNILFVVAGLIALVISIAVGRRLSSRISKPILAIARWSEQFASGVDNLKLEDEVVNTNSVLELDRMVESFRSMAENIRSSVNIIQRVAQGDMTAFVEIRSAGDSLGQNLYHLVQNNDFMFANLLQVADSVATNAEHISSASQALAESSTTQANAVDVLSVSVDRADHLARENANRSSEATGLITQMDQAVQTGHQRMDELLNAVEEISRASEKISVVMKSINDVAFQTNILALNAAVEAARAGEAGKGFAVVADEVRALAAKSSEAADQSRLLIEDTILKASQGSRMASETSKTFGAIEASAQMITGKMGEISIASNDQQACMEEVQEEISRISSVVTANAASSEEMAAATQQMNANADYIRAEMRRFNLRDRKPGKPYIPPEKADDKEFLLQAQQNYEKAQATALQK